MLTDLSRIHTVIVIVVVVWLKWILRIVVCIVKKRKEIAQLEITP